MNSKKTVVITGVPRGLGRVMAERFIEAGHIVLGCGRSEEQIQELRASNGTEHDFAVLELQTQMLSIAGQLE